MGEYQGQGARAADNSYPGLNWHLGGMDNRDNHPTLQPLGWIRLDDNRLNYLLPLSLDAAPTIDPLEE